MKNLYYNLKLLLFTVVYCALFLFSSQVGSMIKQNTYAFGLIQLTISTIVFLFYYPVIAKEGEKLKQHFTSNFLYFLICSALFCIICLSSYIGVMGSKTIVSYMANDSLAMLAFTVFTIFFCRSINLMFYILMVKGIPYKLQEEYKLWIGVILVSAVSLGLVYVMNPQALLLEGIYILITAVSTGILYQTNRSILLYPFAAVLVSGLFLYLL